MRLRQFELPAEVNDAIDTLRENGSRVHIFIKVDGDILIRMEGSFDPLELRALADAVSHSMIGD